MRIGIDQPESFWLPQLADRFGWQPWDMERLRIDHVDMAFTYAGKVMRY